MKRKHFFDEDEGVAPIETFKAEVFDVLVDTVIEQMNERYTVVMELMSRQSIWCSMEILIHGK